MVEIFKKIVNAITNSQYILMREKLNTYMKKDVEYVRRLDFSVEGTDRYYIMMYKCAENILVLIKEREINGCVVRKQSVITKKEFYDIIRNDYNNIKNSENATLREMAWGMQIDGVKVLSIREYVQESYSSETEDAMYSFNMSEMRYTDIPENFLNDRLSYPDVVYAGSTEKNKNIEFSYLKKIKIPYVFQQAY